MTTQKQIEANRRNALKSSGPKTLLGKKRSSQNARKHGLASSSKLDVDAVLKVARLTRALSHEAPGVSSLIVQRVAVAEIEVKQVRMRKAELLHRARELNGESIQDILEDANRMGRYERRANYHRKQAINQLLSEAVDI